MIGWQEFLIPIGLLILASVFGREWLKNLFKLGFGAKEDFEEIKKEFENKGKKEAKKK